MNSGAVTLGQADTRAAIVEALGDVTVDQGGVRYPLKAYPSEPPTPSPLDIWPVWEHTEWINACARATTWWVYVLLPTEHPVPVDLGDVLAETVGSLLTGLGVIQRVEPVNLVLDNAMPASYAVRLTIEI